MRRRALLQGGIATCFVGAARAAIEVATPAHAFAESVGVNIHLGSPAYGDRFDRFRDLLRGIGIRHVRDELRPANDLDRWRRLHGSLGIRAQMLVSPSTNTVPEMLAYLHALGPACVAAIEGQNEGDSPWFMAQPAAGGDWSAAVVAYQRDVFQALRPLYPVAVMPIVSPSLLDWKPADVETIRAAAPFCDIVAIHSYAQQAQAPETEDDYAALSWYLRNMRDRFKAGAPVMATETGYCTFVKPGGSGVSENAAAVYLPRLLLHNFACGVSRTFLYEFIDSGPDPDDSEHHWGLVRHDGSPKPAYHAIRNLLMALDDHPAGPIGRLPVPALGRQPEGPPDLRSHVFRKNDGSLVVAIWRAAACWNAQTATDRAVPPRVVGVICDDADVKAYRIDLADGATWQGIVKTNGVFTLDVGPAVVLVRLTY